MPYVTAIFDRVLSDVTTPTSKGYFNVADWNRIYGNALIVRDLIEDILVTTITFTTVTTPTTSTIPTVTDINTLLTNIENIRLALEAEPVNIPGLVAIKNDWEAGIQADAPDYTDVNRWELMIDLMHEWALDQ